jgi:hypothetical protein
MSEPDPINRPEIFETVLQLDQLNCLMLIREQRREQMEIAAIAAVDDYFQDSELLAFTVLDREDFLD